MTDFSDSPIKQILFDKLVDMGRLSSNPSNSTIQTIRDISDSDALKLLKSLPGGGPELKNMGGMMNINNMTRPVSYMAAGGPMDAGDFGDAPGVDPTVDPLKNTRKLASARTSTAKPYETFLKDAGYTKPASVDDIKKYAAKGIKIKLGEPIGSNTAFRNTLSALNVKQGTQEATNVLNQALQRAKKPLYITGAAAGKETVEDLIGVITNTEFGKSGTKEIRDSVSKEIKDLKTTGNKIHGANPSKTKDAFFKTTLEKMYPVLKNTAKGAAVLSATLAKTVLGKALGPLDLLIDASPSPQGTGELPPEEFAKIMEEVKKNNMQEAMNKQGGGMMNINNMTRPIGYQEGGPVPRSRQQSVMEEAREPTDDLDTIINNRTFRVLHDKDRPMKEGVTEENYFNILPEEEQQIAEELRMQLGISSDSPQYEYIRNKIIEEAEKINKIRQEESQPVLNKGIKSLLNFIKGE